MGNNRSLNNEEKGRSGLLVGGLAFLVTLAAGGAAIAAMTTLGQGSVTVHVGSEPTYDVEVTFYSDSDCTQEITDISCPKGGDNVLYMKLHNASGSDYMDAEVVAGGASGIWANIYSVDGSTTYYQDGNVVTRFNLGTGEDKEMKVQFGVPDSASEGDAIDLTVTVRKEE